MNHHKLVVIRINPLLPDYYEIAAKKSEIFLLLFHNNQVKEDLSFKEIV
jgi:hypothetical protein